MITILLQQVKVLTIEKCATLLIQVKTCAIWKILFDREYIDD